MQNCPELYQLLDETPYEISVDDKDVISIEVLEDYLNSLRNQMKTFQKNEKNTKQ